MSPESAQLPSELEAELVAMVDGRLDPGRRLELEALLESDAAVRAALREQRAAVDAIAATAAAVAAPAALRARIERMALETKPRARKTRAFRVPHLAAGFAAAVAIVMVALALTGGAAADDVLAASTRPSVAPVTVDPARAALLAQAVEGVAFPNWSDKLGWTAIGTRTDTLAGRPTRTVFYERDGRRIAYTIVGGRRLPAPGDSRPLEHDGVALSRFARDGRSAVTWERQDHTCVLSGERVPFTTLVTLAAWDGRGVVRF
jgi:anti-sigma factor RsiW